MQAIWCFHAQSAVRHFTSAEFRTHCWLRQTFRSLNSSLQLHTAENTRPLQQSAYACALSLHSSRAFCLRRKSKAACRTILWDEKLL